MQIKREIDGKEHTFELTHQKIAYAYEELEHECDMKDIRYNIDYLESFVTDEQYKELKDNEDFISNAAYKCRRNRDKYDMEFSDAIQEAIQDVAMKYIDESEDENE